MPRESKGAAVGYVLTALLATMPVYGQDYLIYSRFFPPALPADVVVSVGGYVEELGAPQTWGDEIQYVYFFSDTVGYKYRVWVTNHGGPDDPTPDRIEIRQHPDHPDPRFNGPIEPRHFEYVSHADLAGYASAGHTNEFHVDSTGIYLGAYHAAGAGSGILRWDHDWTFTGQVAPMAPERTESLAYNAAEQVWYAGGRQRDIYELRDTNGDGDYLDESWQFVFSYPPYGGDHHDGMEYVGGSLWISDMISDVLGKWKYDPNTGAWEETGRYVYSEFGDVEGMGFGPCDHFWVGSGFGWACFYELGDVNAMPCVLAEAGRDVAAWPPDLPLVFDASGSHATGPDAQITLYEWDFDGDGVYDYSGPDPVVTHAYPAGRDPNDPNLIDWDASRARYTARLRVTVDDPNGACSAGETTDVDTRTVCIAPPPWRPVADPGGPYSAAVNGQVCLDGSASFHPAAGMYTPNEAGYDDIVLWQWDLENDGDFDATEATVCTSWPEPGAYIVSLSVTDTAGRSDTRKTTVIVGLDAPPLSDEDLVAASRER